MAKTVLRHGNWLGYLLYTLLLVTGLLYYRFPSDTIQTYLESRIAAEAPGIVLSMTRVKPEIPPGLKLMDVTIGSRQSPQKHMLRARDISVYPAWGGLLFGGPEYRFNAHAYDGEIRGRVQVHPEQRDTEAPLTFSVRLKGIHVGHHPYLSPLIGRDVSGTLNGDISFSGQQRNPIDGMGEGEFVVSNGRVALLQPVLGLESIDFDRLSVKLSLKNRLVTLTRVALEGQAIRGELNGTITLNRDVSRSRLNLKGTMEPLGGLLGNMKGNAATLRFLRQGLKKLNRTFVIQGTFRNPVFRFT